MNFEMHLHLNSELASNEFLTEFAFKIRKIPSGCVCVGGGGWSGGAMVLGITSSAGASYNLDYSRTRAYCTCSRCGWRLFGHFYSHLSFLSSFSLSLGDGPI